MRAASLDARAANLDTKRAALDARETALDAQEATLAVRTADVVSREADADRVARTRQAEQDTREDELDRRAPALAVIEPVAPPTAAELRAAQPLIWKRYLDTQPKVAASFDAFARTAHQKNATLRRAIGESPLTLDQFKELRQTAVTPTTQRARLLAKRQEQQAGESRNGGLSL